MQTSSDNQDHEIEVQIAHPGDRIIAYLINILIQTLVWLPTIAWMISMFFLELENTQMTNIQGNETALAESIITLNDMKNYAWLIIGLLIGIAYTVWQIIMMSTRGQSIGKQIMGLAVIKTDGNPPDFLGAVLLREVVFFLGVMVLSILTIIITGKEWLYELIYYGSLLACLAMILWGKDRQTLQDIIAGTVVVKLPPKQNK